MAMKYNILLLSGLIALIIACSTKNNVASNNKDLSEIRSKNDTIRIANDSHLKYAVFVDAPALSQQAAVCDLGVRKNREMCDAEFHQSNATHSAIRLDAVACRIAYVNRLLVISIT